MITWVKKLFKRYYKCDKNQCVNNGPGHYCRRNGKCQYKNKITGEGL